MGNLMNVPRLARGIAEALGLVEQKAFPERLNTDELQAVVSIGPFAARRDRQIYVDFGNTTVNGLSGGVFVPWGSDSSLSTAGYSFPAAQYGQTESQDGDLLDWADCEFKLRGIRGQFTLTGADATALNTKTLYCKVILVNRNTVAPGNQPVVVDEFAIVESTRTDYVWCYPQWGRKYLGLVGVDPVYQIRYDANGPGWDGYIPPNMRMIFQMGLSDGSVFASALSTLDVKMLISVGPKNVIMRNGR